MTQRRTLAILAAGGPAPGINSVIGAATIRARLEGLDVLGVRDGFEWLMQGDIEHVMPLGIQEVSRIHFRGGSHIGISRANPTTDPALLENSLVSLLRLNATDLITIGFQTARHYGVEIVKNLMVDARTTSRWYFVIAMGRKAGHLALGIGKAAGATLTLIPEEFEGTRVRLKTIVDTLVGSIIKRHSYGRRDGVAVIAEGLVLGIEPADLAALHDVERDAHGNMRIAEVNIGEILKSQVAARLKQFGIKSTIVAKNIGYELRCADPIPFDLEYTRDLGYCASKFLFSGGDASLITNQGGHFVPVPFAQLLDHQTGKAKIRMVDVHSTRYAIARRYMIRLRKDDFEDPHELAKFAATCGLHLQQFRDEFEYLVRDEPPPLVLDREKSGFVSDHVHDHT